MHFASLKAFLLTLNLLAHTDGWGVSAVTAATGEPRRPCDLLLLVVMFDKVTD